METPVSAGQEVGFCTHTHIIMYTVYQQLLTGEYRLGRAL